MEKVPVVPDLSFDMFQNQDYSLVKSLKTSLNGGISDDYPGTQTSPLTCGDMFQASISTEPFSFGSLPPQSRQVSFNNVPPDEVPDIMDEQGTNAQKMSTSEALQDRYELVQFSGNVSPLSNEHTMLCEALYPLLDSQENLGHNDDVPSSHLPPQSSELGITIDLSIGTNCILAPIEIFQGPNHPDSLDLIDKLMAGADQGPASPCRVLSSDEHGAQRHQRFVSQMLQIPSTPTSNGSPTANQFELEDNKGSFVKVVRENATNVTESKRASTIADSQGRQEELHERTVSSVVASFTASGQPQINQNQNPGDAASSANLKNDRADGFHMRQLSDYLKICGTKLQKQANPHTKSRLTRKDLAPKANARLNKSKRVGTAIRSDGGEACPRTYSRPIPSQHCHICSRRPTTQSPHAACGNLARGKCRKTICQKCFTLYGWDMAEATAADNSGWLCPHCSGKCPDRAQCHIYDRTSERRRNNTVNHRKPKLQAKQRSTLKGAGARAALPQPFGELRFDSATKPNIGGIIESRDPVSGTTHSSITGSAEHIQPKSTDSSRVPFACSVATRGHRNRGGDGEGGAAPVLPEYVPGVSPLIAQSCKPHVSPRMMKTSACQRVFTTAGRTILVPSQEQHPSSSADVLNDLMTVIGSDIPLAGMESEQAFDNTSCQPLLPAGPITGAGGDVFGFLFGEGTDEFSTLRSPGPNNTRIQ
jgi:hypothetical protein